MPDQLTLASSYRHDPVAAPVASEQVRVSILGRPDSEALLSMLGRCSAKTLYRRFHGISDGVPYVQRKLSESDDGESYVASAADTCVGLGNIHVCGDTAEIGLLVEDAWQRRGVGTLLLGELVRQLRNRGARFLRAEVLADDAFLLRALSSLGPTKISLAFGIHTAFVDLRAEMRDPGRPGSIRLQEAGLVGPH